MNKDIRIKWNVGMELVPETFIHLESQLAEYRTLLRKVQASQQFGLIPGMAFKAEVSLDGETLSIGEVECHALLQDGALVDAQGEFERQLTLSGASDCYLAIWPSDKEREYELDEVPFIANEYEFGLRTLETLPGTMPIAKAICENGNWKLEEDYVVPVIAIADSDVLSEMIKAMLQLVGQIIVHPKFNYLRNHDMMRMLAEEMECVDKNGSPGAFVTLCRRFVRLLSYVITEEPVRFVDYNPYDIQLFLTQVCGFLIKAHEILPTVEIVEYQQVVKQESEPEPEPEVEPVDECPIL